MARFCLGYLFGLVFAEVVYHYAHKWKKVEKPLIVKPEVDKTIDPDLAERLEDKKTIQFAAHTKKKRHDKKSYMFPGKI